MIMKLKTILKNVDRKIAFLNLYIERFSDFYYFLIRAETIRCFFY